MTNMSIFLNRTAITQELVDSRILKVTTEYKKVDRRKKKEYAGELTVWVSLDHQQTPNGLSMGFGWDVQRETMKALRQGLSECTKDWGTLKADNVGWGDAVRLVFRTEATKPSLIISESKMLDILGGDELQGRIEAIVKPLIQKWAEASAQEKWERVVAERAQLVAQQCYDEAEKRAKKIVRLKQRLAALQAELETEYVEQAIQVLATEDFTWDTGEPIDPIVVEAAKRKVMKLKPGIHKSVFRGQISFKPEDIPQEMTKH